MNWFTKLFSKKGVEAKAPTKKPVAKDGVSQMKPYVRRTARTAPRQDVHYREDDNGAEEFLTSAAVAYATDSVVLGALAGGSITGAIVGDILNDREEETSSSQSYSEPSYSEPTTSSWSDSSSSYDSSDSYSSSSDSGSSDW